MEVYWNAVYDDGSVRSETRGDTYADLDRVALSMFQVVGPMGVLLTLETGNGRAGRNLVWRRRSAMIQGSNQIASWCLVGWVPMGPVYAIRSDFTIEIAESFHVGSPTFYPPEPMPGEQLSDNGLTVVRDRIIVPGHGI